MVSNLTPIFCLMLKELPFVNVVKTVMTTNRLILNLIDNLEPVS